MPGRRPSRRLLLTALLRLALAVAVLARLAAGALAAPAPLPVLSEPVHDFASVIDPASAARLDQLSRALQRGTGDVIVVVTIKTFQPDYGDIRDYAVKLFENHGRGIGDKDKDNGLLVVLAVDDRKVWVETGYGLEGAITDGFAGETSRLYMAPAFRQGRYGAGLIAGVTRLAGKVAQQRNVTIEDLPKLAADRPRPQTTPIPFWALPADDPRALHGAAGQPQQLPRLRRPATRRLGALGRRVQLEWVGWGRQLRRRQLRRRSSAASAAGAAAEAAGARAGSRRSWPGASPSHSRSFDQRRRSWPPARRRSPAPSSAPTSTTSFFPRVTAV